MDHQPTYLPVYNRLKVLRDGLQAPAVLPWRRIEVAPGDLEGTPSYRLSSQACRRALELRPGSKSLSSSLALGLSEPSAPLDLCEGFDSLVAEDRSSSLGKNTTELLIRKLGQVPPVVDRLSRLSV